MRVSFTHLSITIAFEHCAFKLDNSVENDDDDDGNDGGDSGDVNDDNDNNGNDTYTHIHNHTQSNTNIMRKWHKMNWTRSARKIKRDMEIWLRGGLTAHFVHVKKTMNKFLWS